MPMLGNRVPELKLPQLGSCEHTNSVQVGLVEKVTPFSKNLRKMRCPLTVMPESGY